MHAADTNPYTLVLVYTSTGHAYLADFNLATGERGDTYVELGHHATLPGAVGEARRLGHAPRRWMRPEIGVPLDLDSIRTPYDQPGT